MTPSPLQAPPNYPPRQQQAPRPVAWILGSIALATFALVPQEQLSQFLQLLPGQHAQSWALPNTAKQTCHSVLNGDQRLSRGQLTQFLSLPQSSSQATVHGTIAPPYCTLSKAEQSKQREAYPLAFDPDTWFVVNYDEGVYTGYDFIFRGKP